MGAGIRVSLADVGSWRVGGDSHSPCLSVSGDTFMWVGLDKHAYLSIYRVGLMCRKQESVTVMSPGLGRL